MRKPLPIPKFANWREELEFWDSVDFRLYMANPATDLSIDITKERKKRITLRLDEDLIEDLKEIAADLGMPYQKVTRALWVRGLVKLDLETQAARKRAARR